MASYLAQQRAAAHPPPTFQHTDGVVAEAAGSNTAGVLVEVPGNEELEDFKNQVRIWLDLDNTLKKLKAAVKERQLAKKELTERILEFMGRYNIEDLNTRDGKLRYKVVTMKEPLTQSIIKSRIKEKIETGETTNADAEQVVDEVFLRENTQKKAVLKRLKRRTTQVDA
jgi:hypothetical protein